MTDTKFDSAQNNGYKLFVVEDDDGIASGIRALAERWGYDTRVCGDFRQVVDEFLAYQPHIVLMDIMLPFANGFHWCAEIRRISRVPILFISSAGDNMNIVTAINMGGDDFIAKPVDPMVLSAKVQAVLRRAYDLGKSSPILTCHGAVLSLNDASLVYGENRADNRSHLLAILHNLFLEILCIVDANF